MTTNKKYTTALAKGQGIIDETLALLTIWKPEMTKKELADKAIQEGILGKATAKRVKDLVFEAFASRYLRDGTKPANYISELLSKDIPYKPLVQLILIYTARTNIILHDYIREVYWAKYSAGAVSLDKKDALNFLEDAYSLGRLPTRWSDQMISRVASYLNGSLADFGFLEKGKKRERNITPMYISSFTSVYLAHELHFSGFGDEGILQNTDWQLFGLERREVAQELQRVSNDHFILQYSGEFVRISWKYQSMEEAINAIARSEF